MEPDADGLAGDRGRTGQAAGRVRGEIGAVVGEDHRVLDRLVSALAEDRGMACAASPTPRAWVAGSFSTRVPGLEEVRAGLWELIDGMLGA